MKKKTKLKFSSVFFVTACFLTCGLSLLYFFTDLSRTVYHDAKEIASIVSRKKIVQRKFSDSVIWEQLNQDSPVYNEDVIRTADGSTVKVHFLTGTTVELDENSMMQIFESRDGKLKLSVGGGNFTVDSTDSSGDIKIELENGSEISLESGTKINGLSKDGKNTFSVEEGSVSFVNDEGEKEFVISGEEVKMDSDGGIKKVPVSIVNVNPSQKVLTEENKEAVISFDIKTEDAVKGKKIYVETSYSPDFSEIEEKREVNPDEKVELKSKEGKLFYRVYAEDDIEESSEGKFTVENVDPPELISPRENSVFNSIYVKPEITFAWTGNEYIDYSVLEIYDENDIQEPVVRKNVFSDSEKISSLSEGNYFWKIIPHYTENVLESESEKQVNHFTIVKEQENMSPVLLLPQDESVISLDEEKKNVLFVWESDVKSDEYTVEFSSQEDFGKKAYSKSSGQMRLNAELSINDIAEGKYFWRVVRKDSGKEYFSDVRKVSFEKYIPKKTELSFPPENYMLEGSDLGALDFMWRLSDENKDKNVESIVEISDTVDFSKVLVSEKTDSGFVSGVSLDDGKYFWRVKIKDAETGKLLEETVPRSFSVVKELGVPEIVAPENNSNYEMTDSLSIKIKWNSVTDADYYNVSIVDENKKIIGEAKKVFENEALVSVPESIVKYGDYKKLKCSVQAVSQEKENSPLRLSRKSENNFGLFLAEKIKLIFPADKSRIDGLYAIKNPVEFSWKEDDSVSKKEFVLTRTSGDGKVSVVSRVLNPKGKIKLDRLLPGTYHWNINAESKNGISLTPDRQFEFVILPVEKIRKPEILKPENGFVINSTYLRNNRHIVFEWNKNNEATDYEFVLYQRKENGTLKKIVSSNTKNNRYELKNFSLLDIGKFEVYVTAFVHAKDGFTIQKSDTAKSEFEINFGLPEKVKVIDPGIMYGE